MSFFRRLEALAIVESSLRVLLRKRAIRQEDVSDFWKVHDRLGLTLRDSRSVRAKVLLEHIDRVLADRTVTDEEASRLRNLCDFLKIDPSEPRVRNALAKVDRAYTLDRLQMGVLPVIPPEQCQINVSPGEKVHAQFRSEMMEERVVRSGYRGGSSGVSFRITRGVRWYVGGSRGAFVSEKELTVAGSGLLCVTSRRIVFWGIRKRSPLLGLKC